MSMKAKLEARREKRKLKIKAGLKKSKSDRKYHIVIHRTNKHFYAQLYNVEEGRVVAGVATSSKNFAPEGGTNSIASCKKLAAEFSGKLKDLQVTEAVFDRAGFRYHGKVKAFADALREAGIKI